jgi:NADH-quinone oxidoreductase subunit L
MNWMICFLPLPPLLAFFTIILFTNKNRPLSHGIAIGAAGLSWLGSMVVFVRALGVQEFGKHTFGSAINWLPTGSTWLKVGVLIDPLSAVVVFFVAWTVLAIFVYSIGYHNFGQPQSDQDVKGLPPHGATVTENGHNHTVPSIEPMYSRFFAFISLFAFGMYTLVVSDNLLTLFVGWEIMGLCSYLLIGFWYGKKSARDAAVKAFMTTRVGDVFMLLGIAFVYSFTGSLSFRDIFQPDMLHALATTVTPFFGLSAAGVIGLLLFIGTVGKSAQWPLHVWLPDAMEGPTPVSAMIHAATMVSAGVYMVIHMFPLISAGWTEGMPLNTTMSIIAFIGSFTALFAATIAVAQNDIKRVLAYSTISQLGFMIAALGIGAYVAAAFHLVTHAFFKALLFLGSGSVVHGMEHGALHTDDHVDLQDMFNMGGLRRKMPVTFWTFLIGGFALSGFPILTAGFWSKDEIFAEAFGSGHLAVFITLALAAFLTAFYTMRQITLTFFGAPRTKAAAHARETTWTMTVPLIVLAVFAVGYGWVGMPEWFTGGLLPNWFHEFVGGTLAELPTAVKFNWAPLLTSLGVALGGLFFGWLVYRKVNSPAEDKLQIPLLKNKYYFDEIYSFLFVKPAYWISEKFTDMFMDRLIIDGILHSMARLSLFLGNVFRNYFDKPVINGFIADGTGNAVKASGNSLRKVQAGRIQYYMVVSMVVLVVFAVLYYFLMRGM